MTPTDEAIASAQRDNDLNEEFERMNRRTMSPTKFSLGLPSLHASNIREHLSEEVDDNKALLLQEMRALRSTLDRAIETVEKDFGVGSIDASIVGSSGSKIDTANALLRRNAQLERLVSLELGRKLVGEAS